MHGLADITGSEDINSTDVLPDKARRMLLLGRLAGGDVVTVWQCMESGARIETSMGSVSQPPDIVSTHCSSMLIALSH